MIEESKKIQDPHDRFFKKIMENSQAAEEFIHLHLPPALAKTIDQHSLQLTDGSFIDPDLSQRRTDILYKATFKGAPGYIYVLIEQQREADPLMPLRMLEYTLKIIRRHLSTNKNDAFPLVFPCVIHNGERPYCYTTDIFEMFQNPELAREIFLKPFYLIDLPIIPDDELKKRPLFGMLEIALKYAATRDVITFIKKNVDLLQQLESMNHLDLIEAWVYYLFQTNKDAASIEEISKEFQKHLASTTQEEVMTLAESFIQQGIEKGRQETMTLAESFIQQGIEKGIEKGIQRGEASLLIRQLKHRFQNELTDRHLYLINEADSDTLAQWGEAFIDAECIEDVFKW